MIATLFIYPSNLPFSSKSPITLKNPNKPLNSLSLNATSNNDNTNNNGNDENPTNLEKNKIKMPTPPWMTTQLFVDSDQVINLSKPKLKKKVSNFDDNKSDKSLTEKVSGRMGKKVVKQLVQSIEKLQNDTDLDTTQKNWGDFEGGFLGENKIGTQKNWGELGGGFIMRDDEEKKLGQQKVMPWEINERKTVFTKVKKEKVERNAELKLDKELLERLRNEASKMKKWIKVKKLGVTQAVVDEVFSIWDNNELVMLKFDLPLTRNMDRAREILEMKTGGIVVWSRKETLVAYRGSDYHLRRRFRKTITRQNINDHLKSAEKSLYEREGDRLLQGLGPRFIDWWYPKPLPVDGDLLPEVVPGFKLPFRLCPPNVRPQLTDDDLTYLRSLARPLPVHFVLGRNSKLQGLANAILKLWEKSVIAKIAVKWGVQNTNNEAMANELKRLTGGTLLLRNKFFIILYRGKDFLPGNVANVVFETEKELQQRQLQEEESRFQAVEILDVGNITSITETSTIGTLTEYKHIETMHSNAQSMMSELEVKIEAEKERLKKELKRQEHKLGILKLKITRVEQELMKLDFAWKISEQEYDQELLTEEESVCFRKMGMKMDKVLVLGRRGVFDGVIEGIHQHWKHREIVKVITMQRKSMQVVYTARFLERESGGILVSIDKLKEGHAIIIYRGKNYKRPVDFQDNLLDKRQALKRSLRMQRLGSLKFFAYQREKEIEDLRHKLVNLQ